MKVNEQAYELLGRGSWKLPRYLQAARMFEYRHQALSSGAHSRWLRFGAMWLPTGHRERYVEEWFAHLADLPATRRRTFIAGLLVLGVPRLAVALRDRRSRTFATWTTYCARVMLASVAAAAVVYDLTHQVAAFNPGWTRFAIEPVVLVGYLHCTLGGIFKR